MINAWRNLVGKPEGTGSLGRFRPDERGVITWTLNKLGLSVGN